MNLAWWDGLSPHLLNIIRAACNEENSISMAETNANNGLHLRKMVAEHGVELREFNDDIVKAMYEATLEMSEVWRSHSPLAKRTYDSMEAGNRRLDEAGRHRQFQQAKPRDRSLIDKTGPGSGPGAEEGSCKHRSAHIRFVRPPPF